MTNKQLAKILRGLGNSLFDRTYDPNEKLLLDESADRLENQGEWISVEERLPEENGRYLACVNVSHLAFTSLTIIAVMEYGKSHGFYLYNETEKVTHWMPFPEAPKEGEAK